MMLKSVPYKMCLLWTFWLFDAKPEQESKALDWCHRPWYLCVLISEGPGPELSDSLKTRPKPDSGVFEKHHHNFNVLSPPQASKSSARSSDDLQHTPVVDIREAENLAKGLRRFQLMIKVVSERHQMHRHGLSWCTKK